MTLAALASTRKFFFNLARYKDSVWTTNNKTVNAAPKPRTVLTESQLRSIAEFKGPACVSLYLGTHCFDRDKKIGAIALGNLLRQAKKDLRDFGSSEREAIAILKSAVGAAGHRRRPARIPDFQGRQKISARLPGGPVRQRRRRKT